MIESDTFRQSGEGVENRPHSQTFGLRILNVPKYLFYEGLKRTAPVGTVSGCLSQGDQLAALHLHRAKTSAAFEVGPNSFDTAGP